MADDFTQTINYTDALNYTYSDSNKIEVIGGNATLKLIGLPDLPFNQPFDSDTGFVYDSNFAEFVGGQVQQKDTRPANATLYASCNTDENSNWADGSTTNTLVGGAAWTSSYGGSIDLTGASGKRWYVPGSGGNFNTVGTAGTIRFSIIFPYSGAPASTRQILEYDAATGNNNAIFIQHSGGNIGVDLRDSSGAAHWFYSSFSPVAGTEYVFELDFDFDARSRLFVDGTQIGSLNTTPWTRVAENGTFRWGGATGNGDLYIKELILFSTVQHTSNHTGEIPYTYYNYIYMASNVTLPEMEYTGIGTLQLIQSFVTSDTNTPKYTLQVGRSGNYLYWNGSAWVTSNRTFAQANDETTFNTNCGSINIVGEIYGQFELYFENSNTNQMACADLTATVTGQTYPDDNPYITPNAVVRADKITGVTETSTKTGSDEIKYVYSIDSTWYYISGGVPTTTTGTNYAESNTKTEWDAIWPTWDPAHGVNVQLRAFLHSETGTTTPLLDQNIISYDFYGDEADEVNICVVWGYSYKPDGNINTDVIKAYLNVGMTKYKNNITINNTILTVTPDSTTGYWELDLAENTNMESGVKYIFEIDDELYERTVPNSASAEFWTLT